MITLKIETNSPELDKRVIEKVLFKESIECTTHVDGNYVCVGFRNNTDAALARNYLRMHSYPIR